MRNLLMAVSLIASASALPAAAHDWSGWQVGVSAGRASGERHASYSSDLSPEGTVIAISLDKRFNLGDNFVAGVEVEGQYGNQEASTSSTCTVLLCGYDETSTRREASRYAFRVGGSLGHPIGPVLVSAIAGLEATDYTDGGSYASPGNPTWRYENSGYRAGYYYGVRGEYPLTDSVSVGAQWRRSDLGESKYKSTGGGGDTRFLSDTYSVSFQYKF